MREATEATEAYPPTLRQCGAGDVGAIVTLKQGTSPPALFITHGAGGQICEVKALVECISTSLPIYGVQARGLAPDTAPDQTIEDMAQYYLDEILQTQPRGPYLLAGLSAGGLVMLEVAKCLRNKGEVVALLAFLDTYPDSQYWPFSSWMRMMVRRAYEQAKSVTHLPPKEIIPRLADLGAGLIEHVRHRKGVLPEWMKDEGNSDGAASLKLHRLRNACMSAMARYQPKYYYDGGVTFIKCEIATRFPDDPVAVWGKFVRDLEVHRVPGDHLDLITRHVGIVGACLSESIDRALQLTEDAGGRFGL